MKPTRQLRALKTAAQAVRGPGGSVRFGYKSIEDTSRRRAVSRKTSHELAILTPQRRATAQATAREDRRNFTLLAWMTRKHLDNVSRFTPHLRIAKAPNTTAKVLQLLRWHSRRRNFDALGRHGRDEHLRMFEAVKVLSGDVGMLHSAGLKLQGIEGDRIAQPPAGKGVPQNIGPEGLVKDAAGVVTDYCICKRAGVNGSTLEFERVVAAADLSFDAYWPERYDSDRGVSPLLTTLNEAADVRETWEWLVNKAKTSAMWGLAFTRVESDDPFPTQGDPNTTPPTSEENAYTDQLSKAVKNRGIINLDLDPGDKVDEIGSDTPNPQVIPFTREVIRCILGALDIPFTMYDSLASSFSARIADRNEYEEACEWKRQKNADVLDDVYGWILPLWQQADLMNLGNVMAKEEVLAEEVLAALRWVPASRPWLDRSSEMSGHILALAAGVTSTPRICSAYGEDAYEIAAEQKEFLEKCGIPLLYAQGGQFSVQSLMGQAKPGAEQPAQQPQPEESPDA